MPRQGLRLPKLRRPAVILSVVGADETSTLRLPAAVEKAYIDGVTGIAGKSDAWIITSGFDAGASGLTGKASQKLKQEAGNQTDTNM